jgi:hypothetical protein
MWFGIERLKVSDNFEVLWLPEGLNPPKAVSAATTAEA